MENLKSFASSIAQIAEERGIPNEKVIEVIEMALAAAYKKDYGQRGQIIRAKLDSKTGALRFWQVKLVVDESMIYSEEELEELKASKVEEKEIDEESKKIRFNEEKHIMVKEAQKLESGIKAGEELEINLEAQEDYGRIAAQTAKQVILQRIKEAERAIVFESFKSKEGEIASGIVQRIEGNNIYLDIGKAVGVLPREEQVRGEFYRPSQRLKVYVMKVEESPKGPIIFLSRIYPKMISRLFELEVPEVTSGQVVIKSIAREAGSRSKIAVASEVEGIDPIGSMVGQRGTRVTAVINELGGEKIDIIEWSDDPEKFIASSLSPAKVLEVKVLPKNKALAIVPEDQLSLAIGKNGQNVRLAAKLTGWKIDVRGSESQEADDETETEEGEENEDSQEAKGEVQEEPTAQKEETTIEEEKKTKRRKKQVKRQKRKKRKKL